MGLPHDFTIHLSQMILITFVSFRLEEEHPGSDLYIIDFLGFCPGPRGYKGPPTIFYCPNFSPIPYNIIIENSFLTKWQLV